MAGPDITRLTKELRDLSGGSAPSHTHTHTGDAAAAGAKTIGGITFDASGVRAEPIGGSMTHLRGWLRGPADTPYEDGLYELDIVIPPEYPFAPPKVKFVTKIWHPNVSSQTGAICLDILKSAWSPALTIKTTLLSISALLSAPEPRDPQDAEVAGQYLRDRREWEATARFWKETYATPAVAGADALATKVETLVGMGFAAEAARTALAATSGNLEAAIERLFSA